MIDEDAGKLVTDRLVDQHGGDGAVDPARQPADHPLVPDLRADLRDGLGAVGAHGPVALEAREPHEILVERLAVRGVVHLGVELHGVEMPRRIGSDGEGRTGRGAEDFEARGQFGHVVAMAHPDLLAARPVEEPAVEDVEAPIGGLDPGATELGRALARDDAAAKLLHHHLLAVADAEDRHAVVEDFLRGARGAIARDAVGAAGKHDGLRRHLAHRVHGHGLVGPDFAIDVQLAQPARDQLRHLGAEIYDEKRVVAFVLHANAIGERALPRKRGAAPAGGGLRQAECRGTACRAGTARRRAGFIQRSSRADRYTGATRRHLVIEKHSKG